MPKWLGSLLQKSYFGTCWKHGNLLRNDLNRYCITCDLDGCQYCVLDSHKDHNVLKIYRHVYKDVVLLEEMDAKFSCSEIQTFRCNRKWAVSLHPLPHSGSGALLDRNSACQFCRRRLHVPTRFNFCSVSCKVKVTFRRELEEMENPLLMQNNPPTIAVAPAVSTMERPAKRSRRKGIPHRSSI